MNINKTNGREHSWDAVRAFLMLLGIPYHTALSYRAERTWIVNSGEGLHGFTYLAEFIHLFRMPGFFLIAGYFAALLLARREPAQWLQGRLSRLIVPFFVSIVTLVPLMNLFCELSNLPPNEAIASWLHNSANSGGYWVRHLWFIIVLLYCSAGAAGLMLWRPALRTATLHGRLDRWIARNLVIVLLAAAILLGLWEASAIELFYKAGLATNLPQQIMRLDELIIYAPYFLIGCLLARAPAVLAEMGRFSTAIAIIAIASAAISLVLFDALSPALGRFVATFAAITVVQGIIVISRRFVTQPIPLVQRLVSASFVMYLFHMPIIILLVYLGKPLAVPVAAKAFTVMTLSTLLSYGAWWVISRSPVLAYFYNGDPLPARQRLGFA